MGRLRVGAQQGLKEFREALAGKGIQTNLTIIRPVPPFVPVFRTVTDHQEQASILRGYDQLVQQTERERVVPVKVLEDSDDRSHAALAQQQADDCLIRGLSTLDQVERPERIDRHPSESRRSSNGGIASCNEASSAKILPVTLSRMDCVLSWTLILK